MSITVKDCLSLPSLSMAKVIAGSGGLDSIVNTISVLEFDDYYDDFYIPNEMVITSFYCARDSVDEQCRILQHSKDSGDVAIVLFYSDIILQGIDSRLPELADRINLPLILLPESNMGLKYSDVISDVMEAILLDRRAGDSFVGDTVNRISQLPPSERVLGTVLALVSNYAKSSFFLCDQRDDLIESSYWPAGNTADGALFAARGRRSDDLTRTLKHTFALGADTLTLYGVTNYDKLSPRLLSDVAQILTLFSSLWNYPLEQNTPESLIPAIIEGDLPRAEMLAAQTGIATQALDHFCLIAARDAADLSPLKDACGLLLSRYDSPAITAVYGEFLVLLFASEHDPQWTKAKLEDLQACLGSKLPDGIFLHIDRVRDLSALPAYYQMAHRCKDLLPRLYPHFPEYSARHLEFCEHCRQLLAAGPTPGPVRASGTVQSSGAVHAPDTIPTSGADSLSEAERLLHLLDPLWTHPDLLSTLSVYLLDAGCEVRRTSELTFLHRNTILYRLDRIREILGEDIDQMPFQYDLYQAVALDRLREG